MIYLLRGADGDYPQGLGVFDPPARPTFIDPGYPADPGIVAANTAANNAYQVGMQVAQASNNYDQCESNAQNANSQAQYDQVMAMCRGQAAQQTGPEAGDLPVSYYTPGKPLSYSPGGPAITPPVYTVPTWAAPPTAVAARGGQLTFTTSRGSNALQVGDTWLVAITGATPNSPVTVSGSMPSGTYVATPMGSTDSNGNFSKAGTVGASDVGAWSETWAVGGIPSGSLGFTVAAGSSSVPVVPPVPGAVVPPVVIPGAFVLPVIGGFDLASIPWWGWAAAAGAAYVAFKGGK